MRQKTNVVVRYPCTQHTQNEQKWGHHIGTINAKHWVFKPVLRSSKHGLALIIHKVRVTEK